VNLCPELRRLSAEHTRWASDLAAGGSAGEAGRARRLLALWDGEIQPHFRREEEVLVPELARRVPEADAAILMTLADHVGLRRLARELRDATGPAAGEVAARLARRLAEHADFEERTLFPLAQEQLGCARLAALGAELKESRSTTQQKGNEP
jgi:hemerythrin-like domain-containing protein